MPTLSGFRLPQLLQLQQKRACPIIFHPVRQALVNLNQRIREKQSTPYGLNRLPETHALILEIYQICRISKNVRKTIFSMSVAKATLQIYGFIKYAQRSDIFCGLLFLSPI